jgi:predicted outer membrane repeat protein
MRENLILYGLLVFTVLFVCIGGISAAGNISDNQSATDIDSGPVVSQSDIVDSGGDIPLQDSSNSNEQVLSDSNNKTNLKSVVFNGTTEEELEALINSSNNTVIYLGNKSIDFDHQIKIIGKNLTFCGGNSLDDNYTSTLANRGTSSYRWGGIFYIQSSDYPTEVRFNRINFEDTIFPLYIAGANVSFDNCIFNKCIAYGTYTLRPYAYTCYLIWLARSNATFNNTKFINCDSKSNFTKSVVFIDSLMSNTSFINCSYLNNSGVIYNDRGNMYIDGCLFENNTIPINYTNTRSLITNYRGNLTINNSRFSGVERCISTSSNLTVNNSSFSNFNDSAISSEGYYGNNHNNVNISNTEFYNNSALKGGAIYLIYGELNVDNCSFVNNSALKGGAILSDIYKQEMNHIYSYVPSNINVNNSRFISNYANSTGGAISYCGNCSQINNCVFVNNTADVCGGAIIIGNSTNNSIFNSNFSNNYGKDRGNDIFYYGGNLSFENNTPTLDLSNFTNNVSSVLNGFVKYTFSNGYVGFCIELPLEMPRLGELYAHFNSTANAVNAVNHKYVGDYIKYLIYKYYDDSSDYGKFYNLIRAIWVFTNYDYEDPDVLESIANNVFTFDTYTKEYHPPLSLPKYVDILGSENLSYDIFDMISDALNAVDNEGYRLPDYGATKLCDNGSVIVYDFTTEVSTNYQNFLSFKRNSLSNISYDINISKTTNNPVVYKGNDTSFDIFVVNNGTVMLTNVTVTEDSFDDLTYKSWLPLVGNWTYNYVGGKNTWTLNGVLVPNQTVSFNVVFATSNSSVGNKTNIVSVTTYENATGNASNITEIIENKTPVTSNNNTPNNPQNNTPNKPVPTDSKTVENKTPKADIRTSEDTGYPLVALIIALIAMVGLRFRKG